jgi:peptidoglycan biosynthesis protein MviN/MurJ (putative lipid II flippase)
MGSSNENRKWALFIDWIKFSLIIITLLISGYILNGFYSGSWELADMSSHVAIVLLVIAIDGLISYWVDES